MKGDFFDLQEGDTGGRFDAVWDRASFVAINPSLREDYIQVMKRLVQPGGTMLVSTLERRTGTEEGMKGGPPFSVPESEVRKWYGSQEWVESIELLEEIDEFVQDPESKERWESRGITSFYELIFVIKTKA